MSSTVSTHIQQIADTVAAVVPTTTNSTWGVAFRLADRIRTPDALRERGRTRQFGVYLGDSSEVSEGDQGTAYLHMQRDHTFDVTAVYVLGKIGNLETLKVLAEDGDKVLGALTLNTNWSAGIIVQDCTVTYDAADDEHDTASITWTVGVRYMPDYTA